MSKPVSSKTLEKYKKKLLELKREIYEQYNHLAENALNMSQRDASGDLSGYSFHMADVATDNFDREFSIKLAANERELIILINEALKRVEEGTYGICQDEDCEKRIASKRLDAIPYATLCIECQTKKEKEDK